MSTEQNKALVRRYLEAVWDRGDLSVVDELIAPDYIQHNRNAPPGRDGVKQFFAMLRAGFPDARQIAEDMLADGDKVIWRWTIRGTHQGPFMGIPATGKQIAMTGMNIVRISNGMIAENWGEQDTLGMMQQLGAIPAPR
jgi:steroid delta-isomerase-like uncharacterized protein